MKWIEENNGWKGWRVDGTPFGVEMVDRACYAPFRLWNRNRIYVMGDDYRDNLIFTSKAKAFAYVEEAVKNYKSRIVISA